MHRSDTSRSCTDRQVQLGNQVPGFEPKVKPRSNAWCGIEDRHPAAYVAPGSPWTVCGVGTVSGPAGHLNHRFQGGELTACGKIGLWLEHPNNFQRIGNSVPSIPLYSIKPSIRVNNFN